MLQSYLWGRIENKHLIYNLTNMKTRILYFIAFIVFSLSAATAQKIAENKVPQDVVISFKYKYADAAILSWELNKDIYIARFKLNDQEGRAEFTGSGVWNLTRYSVSEKELPSPILTYYKDNYKAQEMTISLSELHKDNQGNTFYYLELRKEGYNQAKPISLTFDLSGKFLTKTDPEEKTVVNNDDKKNNKGNKDNKGNKENKESDDHKIVKEKKDKKNEEEVVKKEVTDENQQYIIDDAKVPQAAKNHFASKIKKPTSSTWYLKDKIYTVKFTVTGKNGQSTYTKDGEWTETRTDQSEETLPQLIVLYLKDNYRNFKIKNAELVIQPKEKSIFLRIYDKKSKETPPPLTEMWFSTTGKLISVNKAEVSDYNESDNNYDKKQEEKDNEFLSEVDKKGETYDNSNNYNDKVSFKELPSPIHQYIKQYYKEHYIKSSRLVSDDELGNIYLVTVKLEDSKYAVHLYFDLQGTFLKKIDEGEGKTKTNNGVQEKKESKKPVSKYGTAEESVNPVDLPDPINKYLKKYYPLHKISESFFKSDSKLGNCYLLIMKKAGDNKLVKIYFDSDGNLLKKETENQ